MRPQLPWALTLSSALLAVVSLGQARAQSGTPIVLHCAPDTTIPCRALADSAAAIVSTTGGCGPVTLAHTDEPITLDTLGRLSVRRTWTANDTCGQRQTCMQILWLTASRPRVAVLPFENLAESEEGARIFARLMQDQLAQLPDAQVVPAGEVETATLRARIRLPVLMDNEQGQRLREALDADYFLLGSVIAYQTSNDAYSGVIPVAGLTLQLRDAVSGATVWSDTFHETGDSGEWLFGLGVEHDITKLAHSIARQAASRLSKTIKAVPCAQVAR